MRTFCKSPHITGIIYRYPIIQHDVTADACCHGQINLNIWTHLVLHFVAPNINRPEVEKSARSRLAWAATSVVGIAYSCAVRCCLARARASDPPVGAANSMLQHRFVAVHHAT